jgi:hypothetical protein
MTRKPIHRFLPLTYKPKIPGVLTGWITQSIRIDTDLQVGDSIAFHGWEGKPYHSPWSFRTPYCEITLAKDINVHANSVYLPEKKKWLNTHDTEMYQLAFEDGIYPVTGEELLKVLHTMHGNGVLHGKILRWNPLPIINQDPELSKLAFIKAGMDPFPIPVIHQPFKPLNDNPSKDFIQIGDIEKQRRDNPAILQ